MERMVNLRGARQDLATCQRVLSERGSGDMRYEPMRGEYRGERRWKGMKGGIE
jgi:hypothetical protein